MKNTKDWVKVLKKIKKLSQLFIQGIVHHATAKQAAFYAEILYTVGISF